jgi:hypothetical protein
MLLIRPATIDDAALVSSNVAESEPAYNPATTYAKDAVVRGNTTPTAHRLFESLVASNTGNALTDNTKWLEIGATNRWRMFDTIVDTQTERAESIAVELTTPGRVDSVAVLNCSASAVQVVMTDPVEGVVFDETIPLVSPSGITDWYAYFFEPIERLTDKVITGLPPYAGAEIAVTLLAPGSTAMCGALVIGQSKDIGDAQYGATVGIKDFSRKEQNDFGDYTIVERAFSKRVNFTIWMPAGNTDQVQNLLATYRATPIVYVGSEAYGSTVVFGFYRDFNIELSGPVHSMCSIEIEGLT